MTGAGSAAHVCQALPGCDRLGSPIDCPIDSRGEGMPYGTGAAIRLALVRAKPWQRCLISGAMIAGGAVLVALGHLTGLVLAGAGCLLAGQMVRYRVRSRNEPGIADGEKPSP
jgi:hypothetical protein